MVIAFIVIVELQGAIGVRAMVGSLRAAGALNPILVGSVFGVGWAVCILVCVWGPGRQEFLLDATLRGRFLIRGGAIGTVWSLAATGVTAVSGGTASVPGVSFQCSPRQTTSPGLRRRFPG